MEFRREFKNAFTIIELLIVIGLMALLLSILLPSLDHSRAAGRAAQCISNQHQLHVAFLNWKASNHFKNPDAGEMQNELHRYLGGDRSAFVCPEKKASQSYSIHPCV